MISADNSPSPDPPPDPGIAAIIALGVATAGAVCLIVWVLYSCAAGLDLTDEGYYLNWISTPDQYPASHTQFGFIYHQLYVALGRDLVALRQVNLLIVLGLSWLLFSMHLLRQRPVHASGVGPVATALVLSTSSLCVLYYWLPTPNYNTLALQALLGGAIALTWIVHSGGARLWPWLTLGAAGWLAFMAKPTTAMVMGIVFLVALSILRLLRWRRLMIAVSTSTALLVVSAWMIDGSIAQFIDRLRIGAADLERLQGKYELAEIFRFDPLTLTNRELILLCCTAGLVAVGTYFALSLSPAGHKAVARGAMLAAILLFALGVASYSVLPSPLSLLGLTITPAFSYASTSDWISNFPFIGAQLLAFPAGAWLARLLRLEPLPSAREWVLASAFGLLPLAYVFGTNGNYWAAAGGAGVFWVAAATVPVIARSREARWIHLLPLSIAVVAVATAIIAVSTEAPYRQVVPLRRDTGTVRVRGAKLRVPAEMANYLTSATWLAASSGFEAGSPIIDLSGRSPALLHIINARAIGLAWLCGGYQGSESMVFASLKRVPNDVLRRSWVLDEPDGPRHLSPDVLRRLGLDLERDYVVVGSLQTPPADYAKSFTQRLHRPKILTAHGP